MVTVGYEQERGLRGKHQTPSGYQASDSKTIAVPLPALYAAWRDKESQACWLPGSDLVVRKATPQRSLRATWGDGSSSVDVNFYARGPAKSQVTVQHAKLAGAKEAGRMKTYWAQALARLKEALES